MDKNDFITEFQHRTKQFALRCPHVFQALPKTDEARIVGKHFFRSPTSVAANYRAECRVRSKADYFSKLNITIEEADETMFWLEFMIEGNIIPKHKLENLLDEAEQITKILAKARKNTNVNN